MRSSDLRKTSKKIKVIGKETYINRRTGEIEEFNVISVEERDANFSKIWLSHILEAVDELSNAKIKVMMHLISTRNPITNVIIETYDEIAKAANTSQRTVATTIQTLIEYDIIRRKTGTRGVLFLNPNVIFKGTRNNRLRVLIDYRELRPTEFKSHSEESEEQKKQEHKQAIELMYD
jgi:hypothetical protein